MSATDILVRNEQAKLTATYLNGLAIAFAAVGGLAPWVASAQNGQAPPAVVVLSVSCGLVSAALHLVARRWLKRLAT